MHKSDVGLVGLAVMGRNLALNMLTKGYRVSVYNRTPGRVDDFLRAQGNNVTGTYSLPELVNSLKTPKIILLMIRAGEAVDNIIDRLVPLLNKGDLLIDGGNSFFRDTIRRTQALGKAGILFLGAGISGGEEGALKGPSIMLGGSSCGWEQAAPLLRAISARAPDGTACCAYFGSDGAGHYVKMVHNGIEYAFMQAIAECYFIMKRLLKMPAEKIGHTFTQWNRGKLSSYLIEITGHIFSRIDGESGKPLVELILDLAEQNDTGKWAAAEALNLGVPLSNIAEAVFIRYLSALKEERTAAARLFNSPLREGFPKKEDEEKNKDIKDEDEETNISDLENALYATMIISYAQGFALLGKAALQYGWYLNASEIASVWRAGCIIRARLLDTIIDAYQIKPKAKNMLLMPAFKEILPGLTTGWRKVICLSVQEGVAAPVMASALGYFDMYLTDYLPTNLVQAQRDYFGSHGYKRIDQEGLFHTRWL